jgi:DNA-binding NarL/FixJ family response regulator
MSDSTSLSNAGQPPLRVLLIEDSALIRRSLVEAIDASGVLHVAAYAFDAVIVDLQLKHGSGVPVLAYLQREGLIERTFAAVLTNHALPAYRERCEQYGVRHFYDKSFEFDRVIDALHDYAYARSQGQPPRA